jgi:lipid II:glycine glycyltransferase (peptidoglycan interpeptide bridge formation enzyme)
MLFVLIWDNQAMQIQISKSVQEWESFLTAQKWSPFLQSHTMGEVYQSLGEKPVRLEVRENDQIIGVCQAIVVDARRGKHLAIMYGPILGKHQSMSRAESRGPSANHQILQMLVDELKRIGKEKGCAFIRVSPFWPRSGHPERGASDESKGGLLRSIGFRPAPLHMLAEHIWYINLQGKREDEILMGMRKTTRNLIRRAEKEGVTVRRSENPLSELDVFFKLYDETRKRHHFVPYSDDFIKTQVEKFSEKDQCALYIAEYNGEPVASSVHMIYGGETSYHHGASTAKYPKCYASYLLQWTAIRDALKRGDKIYNFWGISPEGVKKHPFAGVRTFKTGFGGELLELQGCTDLPLSSKYWKTWGIEMIRKWKRGF